MSEALPRHRRGLCLVISAPSGAGKSTIARAMLEVDPGLALSISATTRAPREGERDGVDYHFCSEAAFSQLISSNALLEWAGVFGRRYGTPRGPVTTALEAGQDVLFDIDWQGYRSLRQTLPGDTVGVFVLPPSLAALRQRLFERGDDRAIAAQRMAAAAAEISHWREYDHVIVNTEIDAAVHATRAILAAARCATSRVLGEPAA